MIAVIFEVLPDDCSRNEYLETAIDLAPLLKEIDGFISVERFQSLTHPKKLLSLSFWRDENAVSAWRNSESHRMAQSKGRDHVFDDYRLRVAQVVRDYGKFERAQAPADSQVIHGVKRDDI